MVYYHFIVMYIPLQIYTLDWYLVKVKVVVFRLPRIPLVNFMQAFLARGTYLFLCFDFFHL